MRVFKVKGLCIYLIRRSLFIPFPWERKAAADTLRDGLEEEEEEKEEEERGKMLRKQGYKRGRGGWNEGWGVRVEDGGVRRRRRQRKRNKCGRRRAEKVVKRRWRISRGEEHEEEKDEQGEEVKKSKARRTTRPLLGALVDVIKQWCISTSSISCSNNYGWWSHLASGIQKQEVQVSPLWFLFPSDCKRCRDRHRRNASQFIRRDNKKKVGNFSAELKLF